MALHAAISAIYIAILASDSALALSQQNILDEFSVSYRLASPITLHEPVIVHVSIVNVGDESLLFDLGFNRKKAFQFTVIDPAGHRITLGPVKEEGIDAGGLVRLEPKRTVACHDLFSVSPAYFSNYIPAGRKPSRESSALEFDRRTLPQVTWIDAAAMGVSLTFTRRVCRGRAVEGARSLVEHPPGKPSEWFAQPGGSHADPISLRRFGPAIQ